VSLEARVHRAPDRSPVHLDANRKFDRHNDDYITPEATGKRQILSVSAAPRATDSKGNEPARSLARPSGRID